MPPEFIVGALVRHNPTGDLAIVTMVYEHGNLSWGFWCDAICPKRLEGSEYCIARESVDNWDVID